MSRLFCASSGFHVLLHQAILEDLRNEDAGNHLLMYHPLQNASKPNHSSGLRPLWAMVQSELWESVIDVADIAEDFDISRVSDAASAMLALNAQAELDRRLTKLPRMTDVYITNPTCGGIDRHVWRYAGSVGAKRHFVEDGISAYLTSSLKQRIDAPYWDRVQTSQSKLPPELDARALRPYEQIEPLQFHKSHFLMPEKVHGEDWLGELEALSVDTARAILGRSAMRISEPRVGFDAERLAVYISRPDSEDGIVPADLEIEVAARAIQTIQRSGLDVLVKPHPRDSREKVDRLLELAQSESFAGGDWLPIELVLTRLQPALAFGSWSGSILYSSLLGEIPTASTINALLQAAGEHDVITSIASEFGRIMSGVVGYQEELLFNGR